MRTFVTVVLSLLVAASAFCADVLFPNALHLKRRIDDPISGSSATLDEYYHGNRVVSVKDARTTVVDYQRQEVTEIDHAGGTWSVTSFEAIARARTQHARTAQPAGGPRKWTVTPAALHASAAGAGGDTYRIVGEGGGPKEEVEVAIDRRVVLSRAAVEVIIGASYPNERTGEHDALLRAAAQGGGRIAAASAGTPEQYGLPSEQTFVFDVDGTPVTVKNLVLSVDGDSAPSAALLIDPGARRVESRLTRLDRELNELDRLPAQPAKP